MPACRSLCLVSKQVNSHHSLLSCNMCLLYLIRPAVSGLQAASGLQGGGSRQLGTELPTVHPWIPRQAYHTAIYLKKRVNDFGLNWCGSGRIEPNTFFVRNTRAPGSASRMSSV